VPSRTSKHCFGNVSSSFSLNTFWIVYFPRVVKSLIRG
jgi:hypothetical protein